MEDWLSGLSLRVDAPADVSAPVRSRLASLFQAPVEEAAVAEEEPMGFESEIQPFFELKDWPSARLLPLMPAWVQQALASVAPKQAFLSPPPGFESQAAADEGNAVRSALTHLMQSSQISLAEKLGAISSALAWATATNNSPAVAAVLSCRADPSSKTGTPLEATPLHFAAFCGHANLVELLVKSGAQINAQDCRGRTPLDWAVVGGHSSLLRKLGRDGAMLGTGVTDGRCGLDYAAAIGNVRVVGELVAMGVPLDRVDAGQRTALHWASVLGRTAVVRLLLHAGANPDATSRDQSTPLHWAVAAGHGLCVAELLTGGANPGLLDRRNQRPLDVAAAFGKRDLVEMLVDGGAPALESALLSACRAGRASNAGHVETLKSLIRLGVDVNTRDEQGRSAAEVVRAAGGLPEMIAVLTGGTKGAPANGSHAGNNNNNSSSNTLGASVKSAPFGASANANSNASVAAPPPATRERSGEEKEKRFKNKNKKKDKEKAAAVSGNNNNNNGEEEDGELSNVVHIGSLPSIPGGTLWEAIKSTMSQFGSVRQVRMTPKSTFAFVEYDTVEEAVAAVTQCDGSVVVHGAACTVSWATRRKRKGRKAKGPESSSGSSGSVAPAPESGAGSGGGGGGGGGGGKSGKKKNLCNLFVETGSCSWGANCKYSHDVSKRKQ